MFIALYSAKQLKKLKSNLLLTGLFMAAGGTAAVIRELQSTAYQPGTVAAAAIVLITGLVCVAVARDLFPLKDTYFKMNPSRISFRLTLLGSEQVLQWTDIANIKVTGSSIVFTLYDSRKVKMRLSTIPDAQVARHIQVSIQLAALEQNVIVNDVAAHANAMQLVS